MRHHKRKTPIQARLRRAVRLTPQAVPETATNRHGKHQTVTHGTDICPSQTYTGRHTDKILDKNLWLEPLCCVPFRPSSCFVRTVAFTQMPCEMGSSVANRCESQKCATSVTSTENRNLCFDELLIMSDTDRRHSKACACCQGFLAILHLRN